MDISLYFAAMDSSEFFSAWKQKITSAYRTRRTWKTNHKSLHFQAFVHRGDVDETLTIESARIPGAHRYTIESVH